METSSTVALIKPDGVQLKIIGHILHKAGEAGLHPVNMKFLTFTQTLVERFYEEHVGKPFFRSHSAFMQSGPSLAILFQREDMLACSTWRGLMGPTDPKVAQVTKPFGVGDPWCIRAQYGTELPRNVVHGSDSDHSAQIEASMLGLVPYPVPTLLRKEL